MKLVILSLALIPFFGMTAQNNLEIDQTLAVPAGKNVVIENDQGNVTIKGWQQAKMQVKGVLDKRALGYRFEERGNRVEFIVEMPSSYSSHRSNKGSQLEIFVPQSSFMRFESVNADVDVAQLLSGLKLETINGDVSVTNIKGKINIDTVNGDIQSQALDGNIRIETINGDVKDANSKGEMRFEGVNGNLTSKTQAQEIRIETVNGQIDLTSTTIKELDISTVGGEVEVVMEQLSDDADIQVETVSGNVTLQFPEAVSAAFEVAAHAGGKIKNRLSDDKVNKAKYGPSRKLEFSLNGGRSDVEIDTISGRIELKSQ